MYQYLFDDNTTQKVKDNTEKTKSVLEQFSEIDKKYTQGTKANTDINLQKIDYVAPSKEEVTTKAQNSLAQYKNDGIEKINSDYNLQNSQIDNSIKELKNQEQEQKQSIENTYAKVKENAQNDAIKRGLARSSIIVNKLQDYDDKMINDLTVLSSKTSDKIFSLTTQKNTLELEKNNALKSFNIEYAIKLQNKIDSINEDISKNEQSVIKYNNEIAELEAKWKRDAEQENYDRNQDIANFVAKYGTYTVEILKRDEKYQIAKEYFAKLDKQVAINELKNNPSYEENLGKVNYNKLLKSLEENVG